MTIKQACIPLAGALLMLLAACNPAPTYVKPPAVAPAAYKEVPPEFKEGTGWKLAQPGDDKLPMKWWEMYNDPQLNALEEQVKISNFTIAAAEANYRAAQAVAMAARAGLYPTVGGSTSYTNSRSSSTSRAATTAVTSGGSTTGTTTTGTTSTTGTTTTTTGTTGVINNFSLPFSISYTTDFWHKIRNTIAADVFTAQANAADIATALLSTQTTLAGDYFELRAVDAQRQVLQDTLANYQQGLDLTTTLYKTGIDSEQDVTQAQTQYDTATAQLTDLGVARAQYEHAIATLIGKPASGFSIPPGSFNPNPPGVPVALPSTLLERRPDIAALERQVASENALIGVARAAYYPNLTLSASGGLQSSSFTKWFTWPSRFWSLGPSLSETLFDGGQRRALTAEAEANYDAAVANYRETVLTSFQAVEDQLSASRILGQEVVQQQTAVKSSQHYLDLALIRYKTGVDSYLNVITAQTSVLTNRESEVQIQLRQMTASVQLILALGGGWDTSQLPQTKDVMKLPATWTPNAGPVANAVGAGTSMNPPPLKPPAQ
jgi:NodT family efflux transporter outer membrane factor (OMF) lipoprotein